MLLRRIAVAAIVVLCAVALVAQEPGELGRRELVRNWSAPPFWSPDAAVSPADGSATADLLASSPASFIPITPCRVVDTRVGFGFPAGYGPPALSPGVERSFELNDGPCSGMPQTLVAYSLNVTVVGPTGPGHLVIWPTGFTQPDVSSINYTAGQTIANAVIVPAPVGAVSVVAGVSATNVLIDVNGYYAWAPKGDANTFLGRDAGNETTVGEYNTGIGFLALDLDTSGDLNTAVGSYSLSSNDGGHRNTGVGGQALLNSVAGHENTAIGESALYFNVGGQNNTGVGRGALHDNQSGSSNTALGHRALYFASGSNNIAIGKDAGFVQLMSGSNNIYIGSIGNPSLPGESGQIRIGTVGVHTAGIVIVGIHGFGSSGGIPVIVNGGGRLGTMQSSRRVKEQIRDVAADSADLMRLRPVSFKYKPEVDDTGLTQYGLIAEEVAEVYPELVVSDRNGRPEAVRYQLLDALLLNELQKQRRSLEAQQAEIERLKAELAIIEGRLKTEAIP